MVAFISKESYISGMLGLIASDDIKKELFLLLNVGSNMHSSRAIHVDHCHD